NTLTVTREPTPDPYSRLHAHYRQKDNNSFLTVPSSLCNQRPKPHPNAIRDTFSTEISLNKRPPQCAHLPPVPPAQSATASPLALNTSSVRSATASAPANLTSPSLPPNLYFDNLLSEGYSRGTKHRHVYASSSRLAVPWNR
ncbi:hypothetical protein EJ05DRAFT_511934, partial [Pseudovirgaria hyperparasitica]